MNIVQEFPANCAILHLSGRLDTATAPELERQISTLSCTNLILDMQELTYVSSAGLRVLLMAHKKFSPSGTMKLTGVCDAVKDVLDITGFSDILTVEQGD